MTRKLHTDRSRYETGLRCARARWHEYHSGPTHMGITSAKKPLPLAVGGAVHTGLEVILREMIGDEIPKLAESWAKLEECAVAAALADFAHFKSALDLENETGPAPVSEYDEYLWSEQSSLVEGLVRAYARRRLRPLLAEFEVLEVEREGEWTLASWHERVRTEEKYFADGMHSGPTILGIDPTSLVEIRFMSRPDALLRGRQDNQLYLLSFKTAASWDVRKARDAEHDMQGLSEGIEVERRLAEWWEMLRHHRDTHTPVTYVGHGVLTPEQAGLPSKQMAEYLLALPAPPRILAVRYEYMLKGERWRDKDLAARFGFDARSQKSPLVRKYVCVSTPKKGSSMMQMGDECVSWDFHLDCGTTSKLAWQNWQSKPAWQDGSVGKWIDKLDAMAQTMSGEDSTLGMEPRELGYSGEAQSVGRLSTHPLDDIFIPPIIIYRSDDELRDLVDQMESVERRIAEGVAAVNAAADEGDRRHALNIHFPQTRRSCEYPSTCSYVKLCFGGEDIRSNPLGSGLYKIRTANHPQENIVIDTIHK